MAENETKPQGKIKRTISSAPWVRAMRFIIAAAAAYLLYHAATRFMAGQLTPRDAWIVGTIGVLGLSALVEAIWPEGNHGLLQFWCLTALAASALVSWAAGGDRIVGVIGAIMAAVSFLIAAGVSAGTRA